MRPLAPSSAARSVPRASVTLRVSDFACLWIHDRHGLPRIVHEQYFTRPVMLAHRTALFLQPVQITVAELGVTVTAIGVLLGVFFPQQQFGHAFTA